MTDMTIKTTEASDVAFIRMHGPYSQIPEAIKTLYIWVGIHMMQPMDMPTAVYYTVPENGDDSNAQWEIFTPIKGEHPSREPDKKGCGIRRREAQLVASTIHVGSYETVGTTYEALAEWMTEQGYRMSGPPEESYLSDPKDTPPEEFLTEVRLPVEKA